MNRLIPVPSSMWKVFQHLQALWRKATNPNVRRGRKGERAAIRFLKKSGYRILDRNWKSGRYELDIVAQQAHCVVFVEVKGRQSNALQTGYDAVDAHKKKALQMAIRAYIQHHRNVHHYRLDILAINWNENGKILSLHHYENIPLHASLKRSNGL